VLNAANEVAVERSERKDYIFGN